MRAKDIEMKIDIEKNREVLVFRGTETKYTSFGSRSEYIAFKGEAPRARKETCLLRSGRFAIEGGGIDGVLETLGKDHTH